jgi:hypothetical protein
MRTMRVAPRFRGKNDAASREKTARQREKTEKIRKKSCFSEGKREIHYCAPYARL